MLKIFNKYGKIILQYTFTGIVKNIMEVGK